MEKNRDILKACPAPGYPLLMILLLPAGPQLAGQQISNRIRKLPHLLDPDKTASVNLPGAFQVAVEVTLGSDESSQSASTQQNSAQESMLERLFGGDSGSSQQDAA